MERLFVKARQHPDIWAGATKKEQNGFIATFLNLRPTATFAMQCTVQPRLKCWVYLESLANWPI